MRGRIFNKPFQNTLGVLKKVVESAVDGAKIIDLCAKGDNLIEENVKLHFTKTKNITKGN
jgi:hypothetical protein